MKTKEYNKIRAANRRAVELSRPKDGPHKPRGRPPAVGIRGHYNNCVYDDAKTELLIAVNKFKHDTKTKFVSPTEVFDLMIVLGYKK